MVSGIGPKAVLQAAGVTVKKVRYAHLIFGTTI
jgi:hypothetical protein